MIQRLSGYFFIFLFFGIIALFWLFPPKNIFSSSAAASRPNSSKKIYVQQNIKEIYLSDTAGDGTNWELWAEGARSDEESSSWIFEGVKVNFYRNKGSSKYTVVADLAQFDIKQKNMYFEKNILVVSPNGYDIKANVLNYFHDKRVIESPRSVKLFSGKSVRETLKVDAGAVLVDIRESRIDLSEVESHRQLKERGLVAITSDFARVLGDENSIEYRKNVKFNGMDIFMESEFLRVSVSRRAKKMKSILARKNVHVISENRHAYSQRAFMDVPAEVITMSQSPRLNQDRDVLFGEKIIFYNKSKIVSVKKARAKVDKQGLRKYNEPTNSN